MKNQFDAEEATAQLQQDLAEARVEAGTADWKLQRTEQEPPPATPRRDGRAALESQAV